MITGMNGGTGVGGLDADAAAGQGPPCDEQRRRRRTRRATTEQVQRQRPSRLRSPSRNATSSSSIESPTTPPMNSGSRAARRLRLVEQACAVRRRSPRRTPSRPSRSRLEQVLGGLGLRRALGLGEDGARCPARCHLRRRDRRRSPARPGGRPPHARRPRAPARRRRTGRSRPLRSARDRSNACRVVVAARCVAGRHGKLEPQAGHGEPRRAARQRTAIAAVHGRRCAARLQRPANRRRWPPRRPGSRSRSIRARRSPAAPGSSVTSAAITTSTAMIAGERHAVEVREPHREQAEQRDHRPCQPGDQHGPRPRRGDRLADRRPRAATAPRGGAVRISSA